MVLKWGIVSAGRISFDFVNAMSLVKSTNQAYAIAAREKHRAQEFADKFGIPKVYGSYEEMAKDPEIDVVYIGTTNRVHLSNSLLFLNHKKHVLCEKPAGMTVNEVNQMIDAAKKNNVFFMEGIWSRCNPIYGKIRDVINNGTLGEVQHVQANFQISLFPDKPIAEIKALGSGTLYLIGMYSIQFALWAFNERPLKWEASGLVIDGFDKAVNLTLYFSGNRVAFVNCHANVVGDTSATVYGSKGKVEIDKLFWTPNYAFFMGEKVTNPELSASPYPYLHNNSDNFSYEIEHVRDCIENGKKQSDLVSWNDSLLIAEIVESSLKSIGADFGI